MTTEAPPPAIVSYATKEKTIAAVLMAETGGDFWSMWAVAQVIRNRGADPYVVVTARKQFSCLNHTTPAKLIRKWKPGDSSGPTGWFNSTIIAKALLRNDVPSISVGKATHYHSTMVRPYWAKGKKPIALIGGHKFYKLP